MGATVLAVDARGEPTQHQTADSVPQALGVLSDGLRHQRWLVAFTARDGSRLELPIDSIVGIREA
jgi:hypothetical protein